MMEDFQCGATYPHDLMIDGRWVTVVCTLVPDHNGSHEDHSLFCDVLCWGKANGRTIITRGREG